MYIGLSTQVYDPAGAIILKVDPDGNINNRQRRITKTATLNGGVYIDDRGYSDGDRTFEFVVRQVTEAQLETIHRLVELYSLITCTTPSGLFSGALVSVRGGNSLKLKFEVKEKLSQ